jgi:hypothetical protein
LVRINRALEPLGKEAYTRARDRLLEALLPLRSEEVRSVMSEAGAALAATLNGHILRAVARYGVRLVGSSDELPVAPRPGAPAEAPPPDPGQVRRALVATWEQCLSTIELPDGDADDLAAGRGCRLLEGYDG